MVYWKSIKLKWRKVSQLSLADVFLILEAWFSLVFFNLALRCTSLQRLQGLLRFSPARQGSTVGLTPASARIYHLTAIAAGLHPWLRMTCLCRALALQQMLARRGVRSVLRLGVLNDGSGIHGHAWLESNGVPLGEESTSLDRFSVLRPGQNE